MYRIKILATIPTILLDNFTGLPQNPQKNERFFVIQRGAVTTSPCGGRAQAWHRIEVWVDSRAGLNALEKRKFSLN
jgi:hypothetical protein